MGADGTKAKILVVDDEPGVARLIVDMVGELGYEGIGFGSGAEALGAFREAPGDFGAVISDQQMPEMTGIQLARRVFAIRDDVPFVLLTGYTGAGAPEAAARVGIRAFLTKPFTLAEIGGALEASIEGPGDTA